MLLRKVRAFLKRDLLETLSYKTPFFFDFLRILAGVITFFFIARVFGTNASPYLERYGGGYFPFVLVGLAFAAYQNAALSGLSTAVSREQGHGTLEAILITPTSLSTVILAGSLRALISATVRIACYLGIGVLVFGADLSGANVPAMILAVILTVTSLSGPALFSAGFILAFKRGSPLDTVLNGVSRLLAGVYFPVAVMPDWLQSMAQAIPLTHSLEALRKAVLQGAGIRALGPELLALCLFTAALLPAGLLFLRWSVRRAKDEGSLAFQ